MSFTPILGIGLMTTSQAQKEAVFNTAMVLIDAVFRGSVLENGMNTPPGSPAEGDAYIIGSSPTGAWAGQLQGTLTFYYNGWQFVTPPLKLRMYDAYTSTFITYQGSGGGYWTTDASGTPTVLDDLTNVAATSPTNGQVLMWESGTSKWTPETLPSATTTLAALTDVTVTEGAGIDGKVLYWNNGASTWEAKALITTLAALTDVTVTEGAGIDGYVLYWNNGASKWEAKSPSVVVAALSSVADVTYTGLATGKVLAWNGAAWAPTIPGILGYNQQTSNYTLAISDASTFVDMFDASANNCVVPPNSSVAFPIGTILYVGQSGAGVTTLVAGVGVTIHSEDSDLTFGGQYSVATLFKVGTNVWQATLSGASGADEGPVYTSVNAQTVSYTTVIADEGALITMSNASANNLTVPLNSSVPYPIGTVIDVQQIGAGITTIVATGGVTINAPAGLVMLARYTIARLIKSGTDTWDCTLTVPTLATVAITGAYSDLTGKPTLVTTLAALIDVNVTEGSGINGDFLQWNNGTSKWVAGTPGLQYLFDVSVTPGSGIDGFVLYWNNGATKWEAKALPSANVTITSQTANYIFVLGDENTWVRGNKATALTFTVPPNSSVAFDIGCSIIVDQMGVGQLSVAAGIGVTIDNALTSLNTRAQFSVLALTKMGTDEWILTGDAA